jgi:hypothetical protein
LHARDLRHFDETERLNPPGLANLSESDKVLRLGELFEEAYASNATIRAQLFDLSSLEVVRLIEDESITDRGSSNIKDE